MCDLKKNESTSHIQSWYHRCCNSWSFFPHLASDDDGSELQTSAWQVERIAPPNLFTPVWHTKNNKLTRPFMPFPVEKNELDQWELMTSPFPLNLGNVWNYFQFTCTAVEHSSHLPSFTSEVPCDNGDAGSELRASMTSTVWQPDLLICFIAIASMYGIFGYI